MKSIVKILFITFLFAAVNVNAQNKIENLIIITTDGLRWQEVFKGLDTSLAKNTRFNQGDSSLIFEEFYKNTEQASREKLLPFVWGKLGREGQLYGNRQVGNKVNTANNYWFSYPGYSELFTGYADERINSNAYPANPNVTVLEFINRQAAFKNKVVALGAWNAFDRILNEERAGFPVISAFDASGGVKPSEKQVLINQMLADSYRPWNSAECMDVYTHYAAMEHLKIHQPKVLYIAYGETDEWAHAGQYRSYLQAAHQVDKWLQEIWTYLQSNPRYKNKTALLITVDHGRGDMNKNLWTEHGKSIPGSDETWFGLIAPGIAAKGEIKTDTQLYQQQLAQTIASLLGLTFRAEHTIAEKVKEVWK